MSENGSFVATVLSQAVEPGSQLRVELRGFAGPFGAARIHVGVLAVSVEREKIAFSTSSMAMTSEHFVFEIEIPTSVVSGLHILAGVIIVPQDENSGIPIPLVPSNLMADTSTIDSRSFFVGQSSDLQSELPGNLVKKALHEREERVRAEITLAVGEDTKLFEIIYLFSEMLIHAPQHCKGYSILPFGDGMQPISYLAAVHAFTSRAYQCSFTLTEQQISEFSSQRPLAAIAFHRVRARSVEAALAGVRPILENIVLASAYERGQLAEAFACMGVDGSNIIMALLNRTYRGNLIGPFDLATVGEQIENLSSTIHAEPFAKLLMELYVQALSEREHSFAIFRYWAILELLAKREIPMSSHHIFDPNGKRILLSNGDPVTTSKAEAKVYKYLFDKGTFASQGSSQLDEVNFSFRIGGSEPIAAVAELDLDISLWDFVRAVYNIRNAVAHGGRFSPSLSMTDDAGIASSFLLSPAPDALYQHLRDTTKIIVTRELHALSPKAAAS